MIVLHKMNKPQLQVLKTDHLQAIKEHEQRAHTTRDPAKHAAVSRRLSARLNEIEEALAKF